MTSAFGGQHSIQLSYGCLGPVYNGLACGLQRQIGGRRSIPGRIPCPIPSGEEIVAQLQRRDQRVDLFRRVV